MYLRLTQCGPTQVSSGHSQHGQPAVDLHRIITEHQQARSVQIEIPHLARSHRLLGRYGIAVEACVFVAQDCAQLVPRLAD